MKINILSYVPAGGWILRDYSERLAAELCSAGASAVVSDEQLNNFDLTYHVNYLGLLGQVEVGGIHCTNITHVDEPWKFDLIKKHVSMGVSGICVSEDTARRLRALIGFPDFSSVRLPAMLEAKCRPVRVLVSSRHYPDGRKNGEWVIDFCTSFQKDLLEVTIMGQDWESIVERLHGQGCNLTYIDHFEKNLYVEKLDSCDYLLYTGFDEGAVSVADAVARGVKGIASAQGFHLDFKDEIMLFTDRADLMRIARKLSEQASIAHTRARQISDWTSYANAHLEIWSKILAS